MDKTYVRVPLHILFWALMYFLFTYLKKPLLGLPDEEIRLLMVKEVLVIAAIFYFLSYYVFSNFIARRKFVKAFISLILVYYFYATTVFLEFKFLPYFFSIPGRGYQAYMQRTISDGYVGILMLKNVGEIMMDFTYLIAPALIVKLFVTLIKLSRQALKLEMENLNLELVFLKAQINPHFLFNTLNSVYSLALVRSEQTADTVLKLSDLMRYTLYESNTAKISLEKEFRFFRNYIELERIRHSSRITIVFEINGDYKDLFIAPLIIFPFIENAFKHGINSASANSWVTIKMWTNDGVLRVEIRNARFHSGKRSTSVGGIGIPNTKKRLNLLYPGKHSVKIVEMDHDFLVALDINLR